MNILKLNHLNKKQKSEVNALTEICLNFDQLERTLYLENDLNYYADLECFYLLYIDNKLVSVLTIYQPNKNEAEISAYTLPTDRRKGYFNNLLKSALDTINIFQITHIVFVVEPNSKSGNAVIDALGACYEKSEYLMSLKLNQDWLENKVHENETEETIHETKIQETKIQETKIHETKIQETKIHETKIHETKIQIQENTFSVIEMNKKTVKEAIEINIETLNTNPVEARYMFQEVLEADDLTCYLAFYNKTMIGICCVSFGSNCASIFALGIKKIYQGNGYGRKLLIQVVNNMKDKKFNTVSLQVGSESKEAFSLYKSLGFQIKSQYDYYLLS